MSPWTKPLPYWAIYCVLVMTVFIATYYIPSDSAIPITNEVKDSAAAILAILKDMTTLITTLNTAMLGAAAALAIKGNSWTDRWSRLDSKLIILAFISGAISYFGVYLSYIRILTMVMQSNIDPLEAGLLWAIRLQYYGTIFGVALLGLVFVRMLEGRIGKEPEANPAR